MLVSNRILELHAMQRDKATKALQTVVNELDDFTVVSPTAALWNVDDRFVIYSGDDGVWLEYWPKKRIAPQAFEPAARYKIGGSIVNDVAWAILINLTEAEIKNLAERPGTRLDEEFGTI